MGSEQSLFARIYYTSPSLQREASSTKKNTIHGNETLGLLLLVVS